MRYIYIDEFSGIAGFAYGAYLAGMKFIKHYYSEINEYCIELYSKRFPEAVPLGDITRIDWELLRSEENKKEPVEFIITGGFP